VDWVKLTTDYYRDLAIAVGSDAQEVMFTRGCALAGEIEQHGFIPDALLAGLTRRPAQAKTIAAALVKADLWDRVKGGYVIVNWDTIQAELERIVEKKKRDRERKRAERAAARGEIGHPTLPLAGPLSMDGSADSPATRPGDRLSGESKSKRTTAAARTDTGVRDLPPAVAILRSKLDARKLTVRWNNLTADELAEIGALIVEHGDAALIDSALRSFRTDSPPVLARAWLGQWRDLRHPGDLAAVPDADPCPEPGHSGTTRHCVQCASERKAAR
jgi:hypothetical protein